MSTEKPCPFCDFSAHFGAMTSDRGPVITIDCPGCGRYRITTVLQSVLANTREDLTEVRGWVYDQNALGAAPELDTSILDSVRQRRAPSLADKIDRLLLALVRDRPYPSEPIPLWVPHLLAATHAKDLAEIRWIAGFLEKHGWLAIEVSPAGAPSERFPWSATAAIAGPMHESLVVTPEGYLRAEELLRVTAPSDQGFVAMSFSQEMRIAYDRGIEPAIIAAGYRPIRVDRTEHINKIDDEIIAQIRRSRFVVADFTEHKSGVYFEVGYAMGREIPVIWCCRKDQIKGLHFDVRQFNCIDWETPEELQARLQTRIEAAIGDGPLKRASPAGKGG